MDNYLIVYDTLMEGCYLTMLPDGSKIHAFRSIDEAYYQFKAIEKTIVNSEKHFINYENALKNLRPCIVKAPDDTQIMRTFLITEDNPPIFLENSGIQFGVPVIKVSPMILMYQEVDIAEKILSKSRRY